MTVNNAARTGNAGSYGSFSGSTGTVPASAVVPGAVLHCVMTNTLANPTVSVSKVASPTSVTDAGNVVNCLMGLSYGLGERLAMWLPPQGCLLACDGAEVSWALARVFVPAPEVELPG